MNLLLNLSPATIVIIMIVATIIISLFIIFILKNKTKNMGVAKQKRDLKNSGVKLVKAYCSPAEMQFLEAIHKALPKDFIAFPYVPIEKLLIPNGSKVNYNLSSSKVIDVCIFLQKNMEPVLAIDLYSPSPINQSLKKIDEDTIALIKSVKLPFIQFQLQENYNLLVLKNDLINSMDNKVFAKIKK